MKGSRARRIALFEPLVQKLRRVKLRFPREPFSQSFVVLRREVDPSKQRANIKTGTADDDRSLSALYDIANRRNCVACITSRRIALRRIEKRDEMVRHARQLLCRGRGGADGHPAIDLSRICSDDLRTVRRRELECDIRLSTRRRAR